MSSAEQRVAEPAQVVAARQAQDHAEGLGDHVGAARRRCGGVGQPGGRAQSRITAHPPAAPPSRMSANNRSTKRRGRLRRRLLTSTLLSIADGQHHHQRGDRAAPERLAGRQLGQLDVRHAVGPGVGSVADRAVRPSWQVDVAEAATACRACRG